MAKRKAERVPAPKVPVNRTCKNCGTEVARGKVADGHAKNCAVVDLETVYATLSDFLCRCYGEPWPEATTPEEMAENVEEAQHFVLRHARRISGLRLDWKHEWT